jgi:hypothetical protein
MANARGKNFGPPMTLGNMRQNGVRAVIARCEACGHAADVNVGKALGKIFRRSSEMPGNAGFRIPSAPPSSPAKRLWFHLLRKSALFQGLAAAEGSLRSSFLLFAPGKRLEAPASLWPQNSVSQN